jgi:2-hydroxy-3-oxopropionate reductase
MRLAFLGTGLMGAPMVRRLAAAGIAVTVWNRTAAKAEALADVATVASDPVAAVQEASFVITMLMDGPATRDLLVNQGVLSACPASSIIIDMGSVDPATDQALAMQATARGLGYLDAPVSGGVVGAEAGSLSIFVGGPAETVAQAMPIFNTMGRPTHLGPVGSGQVTKLANQLIVATTIGAVAEGLRLAEAGGCDPALVRDALKGGFADSRILDLHGGRMVRGDFTPGGRSVAQLKDIDNALTVASGAGLDLPLSRQIAEGFRDLVSQYDGGDLDHAAYYLWLKLRAAG